MAHNPFLGLPVNFVAELNELCEEHAGYKHSGLAEIRGQVREAHCQQENQRTLAVLREDVRYQTNVAQTKLMSGEMSWADARRAICIELAAYVRGMQDDLDSREIW